MSADSAAAVESTGIRPQWRPRSFVLLGLASFLPCFLALTFTFYSQATPLGSIWYQALVIPLVILAFAGPFVVAASLLGLVFRTTRWFCLALLIAFAGITTGVFLGLPAGHKMRLLGFGRLPGRAEPLVRAIQAFEDANGAPPLSLEELVPGYLTEIPTTRMRMYPEFAYYVGEKAQPYGDNLWVLRVFAPITALDGDALIYLPKGNYDELKDHEGIERMGHWAYVHD